MRDGAVELRLGDGDGTGEWRMRVEAMSGDEGSGWTRGDEGRGSAAGSVFERVRVCDGVRAVDGVRAEGVRLSVVVVNVGVIL